MLPLTPRTVEKIAEFKEFFGTEKPKSKKSKSSYYDTDIDSAKLEQFKNALQGYFDELDKIKNKDEPDIVREALRDKLFKAMAYGDDEVESGYKQDTLDKKVQGSIDFVIKKDKSLVAICEAKKPKNSEMISKDEANKKALWQAILYYFREREKSYANNESFSVKYIIITNFYDFYFFKQGDFEDFFYDYSEIRDLYEKNKSFLESDEKATQPFMKS